MQIREYNKKVLKNTLNNIKKLMFILNNIITQHIKEIINKQWKQYTLNGNYHQYNHIIRFISVFLLVLVFQWYQVIIIYVISVLIIQYSFLIIKKYILYLGTELEKIKNANFYEKNNELLEYIKYQLMIQKGYELRSNTNIMINQEQLQQSNKEDKITCKNGQNIKKLFINIQKLNQQLQMMLINQQQPNNKEKIYQIRQQQYKITHKQVKLKEIIELNKKIKQNTTILNKLATQYQQQILINYKITKLISIILYYQKIITKTQKYRAKLQQIYTKYKNYINCITLTQKNTQLYQILIKQNLNSSQIDILKTFSLQIQNQLTKHHVQNHTKKQITIVDDNNLPTKIKQQIKQEQNIAKDTFVMDRKKFMNELNYLLIRGMALKKQEQFFKSATIQQSEQITLKKYKWRKQSQEDQLYENNLPQQRNKELKID